MEAQNSSGTTKADNLEQSMANKPGNVTTSNKDTAYPNKANESKGAGSPYGGTQSSDGKAPDGYQQVDGSASDTSGATLPEAAKGDEYGSQSSYGDQGDNREGDDNGGTDARGSSVS